MSSKKKIKIDDTPEDQIVCPSCGRYVGPYETCPFCGAHLKKRLAIKIFKYIAIFYSIIGLFFLFIIAKNYPTPYVQVKDIGPTMNFAHIKIKGVLDKSPSFYEASNTLILSLNDGTGKIKLAMFKDTALKIKNKFNPQLGDYVSAEGSLKIKNNFYSLNITSADKFKLKKQTTIPLKQNENISNYINKKINAKLKIISISKYKNLIRIISQYDKHKIKVSVYENNITPELRTLNKNNFIKIEGVLTKERNILTIVPIKIIPVKKKLNITKINKITEKMINKYVEIEATIIKMYYIKKGRKLIVKDETGEIIVIIWNSVYNKISNNIYISKNKKFIFSGKIKKYKDKLEIIADSVYNTKGK